MATDSGTGLPPFVVYDRSQHGNSREESTTTYFYEKYRNLSPEELRLQDYKNHQPRQPDSAKGWLFHIHAQAKVTFDATRQLETTRPDLAGSGVLRVIGCKIILFRVSSDKTEEFSVHESLVSQRSEFVRAALRAINGVILLPGDDPQVFIYQCWLYGGTIDVIRVPHISVYETLVRAYIFGDKMLDDDFKDCIISSIMGCLRFGRIFNVQLISLVIDNTPAGAPIRRLWMDVYYNSGCADWLDESFVGEPISSEFLAEYSPFQARKRESADFGLPAPFVPLGPLDVPQSRTKAVL